MKKISVLLFIALNLLAPLEAHILIGIAGGTGSGKTTLADNIAKHFGDEAVLISQDSYYKDFSALSMEERDNLNFDHPDSLDFSMLQQHLQDLKNDKPILVPIYDYATHSRMNHYRLVNPKNLVIVEGILLLTNQPLREMFDLKIYIDTDDDIRILRRLKRDVLERGRTFESVKKQYIATVKPMHKKFVKPSKAYADLLIYGVNENSNVIIKLINSFLEETH